MNRCRLQPIQLTMLLEMLLRRMEIVQTLVLSGSPPLSSGQAMWFVAPSTESHPTATATNGNGPSTNRKSRGGAQSTPRLPIRVHTSNPDSGTKGTHNRVHRNAHVVTWESRNRTGVFLPGIEHCCFGKKLSVHRLDSSASYGVGCSILPRVGASGPPSLQVLSDNRNFVDAG